MNTSITISKLGTLAFTILLATNLCGMESNAGKRKRNEQTVEIMDCAMQTDPEPKEGTVQPERTPGQQALLYLLLEEDKNGKNALGRAVERLDSREVQTFLAIGMNINQENNKGETLLHRATLDPYTPKE